MNWRLNSAYPLSNLFLQYLQLSYVTWSVVLYFNYFFKNIDLPIANYISCSLATLLSARLKNLVTFAILNLSINLFKQKTLWAQSYTEEF